MLREGKLFLPRNESSGWLSNTKWSALKLHNTQTTTKADSQDIYIYMYVYIYICTTYIDEYIYTIIIIEEEEIIMI